MEFSATVFQHCSYTFRRRFEVELQAKCTASDLECLIQAGCTTGEPDRTKWKVEGFTVPVKDGEPFRKVKLPSTVGFGIDREPANFLLGIAVYAGTERAGDKLCAEAYA